MLTAYQQTTRRLAGNDQTFARISDFDLRDWINIGRGQIAGEGKCIAVYASLTIAPPTQQYPFTSIALPSGTLGIGGVLAVRLVSYAVASGFRRVTAREWEWFNRFVIDNPVPVAAPPRYWAQYGQGANGTIFVNLPDTVYTLAVDTVCYPAPLNSDSDPEALPYLWTDAVPYFAAYMAYLQMGDKDKAQEFYELYSLFMQRARDGVTPTVLPHLYRQSRDPTLPNKLGIGQRAADGAG